MKTNADYWEKFVLNDLPYSYSLWFGEEEKYLKKIITRNSNVLDIACGNGRTTKNILPITKQITCVDHDQQTILNNIKNQEFSKIKFIKSEAENLPFKNNTFDFVICMASFYNFGDKKISILKEMKRVLKKSGFIILDTFSEDALEERLKVYEKSRGDFKIKGTTVFFDDGIGDKISEQFSKEQLEDIFSQAGLIIKDITKAEIAYLCKLKIK